jgi:hypothetical protein
MWAVVFWDPLQGLMLNKKLDPSMIPGMLQSSPIDIFCKILGSKISYSYKYLLELSCFIFILN